MTICSVHWNLSHTPQVSILPIVSSVKGGPRENRGFVIKFRPQNPICKKQNYERFSGSQNRKISKKPSTHHVFYRFLSNLKISNFKNSRKKKFAKNLKKISKKLRIFLWWWNFFSKIFFKIFTKFFFQFSTQIFEFEIFFGYFEKYFGKKNFTTTEKFVIFWRFF